ncbi:hypothetical protein COTS27_01010 [Spirochaetota bacterium]|nr:hypothetical protein COTS27_01010 [Spirochaetota bacterium]
METMQKSLLKTSKNHFNVRKFALFLLLCIIVIIFITNCTPAATSNDRVPPPASSLELEDITVVPSGGDTSPYAAAIATIEGAVIVVSGITNLADARSETLTLSIADRDNPATYVVDPASITIPGTVLNPDGTNAAANRLEGVQFVLTPVAAGSEAITYSIEVRLSEFVAPPSRLPAFAVEDITITPSGGDTSLYAAATPTIEGDTIVISGITNLADVVRTETTLTVSIADTDTPADYTAEPSSVIIPANVLNPVGTGVVNAVVPNVAFVLTPVAAGGTAVTFNVELRLDALAPLPPLEIADITIDNGSHPAYSAAMVSSITGNVITISGIKNKEDGFSVDLMLTISSSYRVTEQGTAITRSDNALTLAGAGLNPPDVASTTTAMDDEGLSFTVTAAQSVSASEKYYVRLMLGDLIQLRLLGGNAEAFVSEVLLSEGTSSSAASTATLKNCDVVTGLPANEVLVGGITSTAYALTGTVNSYAASSQTNFVLSRGAESHTFPLSVSAPCSAAALSGAGTSGDPYIIDNDRKLNLLSELIDANAMNSANRLYAEAHYRVDANIDLGLAAAPWSEGGTMSRGFAPIGVTNSLNAYSRPFGGNFDCNNKEIANLYINTRTLDDRDREDIFGISVGLFGYVLGATIQNCALTAVKVAGRDFTGGLVARASISTTIRNSYVTGSVTGDNRTGGLVGDAGGNSKIIDSYATVSVTGFRDNIGGLVGAAAGRFIISNSYATGAVSGSNNVGGLVGFSTTSMISNSYATGAVSGSNNVGGLVGFSSTTSTISNSYATGAVSGSNNVGGLVGQNRDQSTITHSYAIGNVTGMTGGTHIGPFIGFNGDGSTPGYTGVTASYYNSDSTLTGGTSTTGVGSDTDGDSSRTTANVTGQSRIALQSLTATATGWDGNNIWEFTPTTQYPRLKTVVCANRQYANPVPTTCTDL